MERYFPRIKTSKQTMLNEAREAEERAISDLEHLFKPISFTDMSLFHQLPDDIWIEIFQQLTSPSDLYHIIQSCSQFYHFGIRSLYRNVHYECFRLFEQNSSLWVGRDDALADVTQRLSIGMGFSSLTHYTEEYRRQYMELDFGGAYGHHQQQQVQQMPPQWVAFQNDVTVNPRFSDSNARATWFNDLSAHITSFRNLRELAFEGMSLPPSIYDLLQSLPKLRHLSLKLCILVRPGTSEASDPDLAWGFTLPLTSLTIEGIRWRRHNPVLPLNLNNIQQNLEPNTFHLISTAKAQLSTLRMEWTFALARTAIRESRVYYRLPSTLKTLELGPCSESLLNVLLLCIEKSRVELEELMISPRAAPPRSDQAPQIALGQAIPDVPLPMLRVFEGPVRLVLPALRGNEVVERMVLNSCEPTEGLTSALGKYAEMMMMRRRVHLDSPLSSSSSSSSSSAEEEEEDPGNRIKIPALRSLSLILKNWDIEIMHCIVHCFPWITTLCIQYHSGGTGTTGTACTGTPPPDVNTLTSLGAEFLDRMREIEVFEVFGVLECSDFERRRLVARMFWERVRADPDEGLDVEEEEDGVEDVDMVDLDLKRKRESASASGIQTSTSIDHLGPSGGPDVHEFLASWKRYTPNLKEVRLVKEFTWRRERKGKGRMCEGETEWSDWRMGLHREEEDRWRL